jgi:hypothetical protein
LLSEPERKIQADNCFQQPNDIKEKKTQDQVSEDGTKLNYEKSVFPLFLFPSTIEINTHIVNM